MQRRTLVFLALAVLTVPGWAQDKPPVQEKKLTFKMKDASVDAVLQYVSSVTGWIFVQEKPTSGTITAVSDTDVPVSQVLDFLNSALRPHGRVILNPNSPDLPAPGQTLKVLDVSDAMKRGADIHVGSFLVKDFRPQALIPALLAQLFQGYGWQLFVCSFILGGFFSWLWLWKLFPGTPPLARRAA